LGVRTAYEDQEARARLQRHPALLSDAAGVWYDEFSNLQKPLTLKPGAAAEAYDFSLAESAQATLWADGLQLVDGDDGAEVLVEYNHPHFGRFPTVTTRAFGAGRITYVALSQIRSSLLPWSHAQSITVPGHLHGAQRPIRRLSRARRTETENVSMSFTTGRGRRASSHCPQRSATS